MDEVLRWLGDASKLVPAGVAAGVAVQVIQTVREWRKDTKVAEQHGTYLAIRIAVVLEAFALACAYAIEQNRLHDEHNGEMGKRTTTLPDLGVYPTDGDWKSLQASLMSRALTLRNELSTCDRAVHFYYDLGEEEQALGVFNHHAGRLGYRGWILASELRTRYAVQAPANEGWDFVEVLVDAQRQEA